MRPKQIDIILTNDQKRYLTEFCSAGKGLSAIKELRDLLDLGLMEARDYIKELEGRTKKIEIKKAIKITTYDELKEYLIKNETIKDDDDILWDIVDLAFDAGIEEGETIGYKMRLKEEGEER